VAPVAEEWKTHSCPGVVSSTWRALFPFFFPLLIPAEEVRIQELRGRSSVLLLITVIATCPTSTLQRRSHPRGKLSRELELLEGGEEKSQSSEPRSSFSPREDRRCSGSPLNSRSAPRQVPARACCTSHSKRRHLSVFVVRGEERLPIGRTHMCTLHVLTAWPVP
jgi:hypothetical protein